MDQNLDINLTKYAKEIFGIDLELFAENELIYKIEKRIFSEIINSYSIKTEEFLPIFIKELSDKTGLEWQVEKVSENFKKSYLYEDPRWNINADFTARMGGVCYQTRYKTGHKDSIILKNAMMNANIIFAEQIEGYCPKIAINSSIFNNVKFDDLSKNTFTSYLKQIFCDAYSSYIVRYKNEIVAEFTKELEIYINRLIQYKNDIDKEKNNWEFFQTKMKKKIKKLGPISKEKFDFHNSRFYGNGYEKYSKCLSNDEIGSLVGDFKISKEFNDAKSSLNLDKSINGDYSGWKLAGTWKWDDFFDSIDIEIYKELPEDVVKLIELYDNFIKNIYIDYEADGEVLDEVYNLEEYNLGRNGSFEVEHSSKLMLKYKHNITTEEDILNILNELEKLIKKIKTSDLTSPCSIEYKDKFISEYEMQFPDISLTDEKLKKFMHTSYIEGEAGDWYKKNILKLCEVIEEIVLLAQKIILNSKWHSKKVIYLKLRAMFYDKFYIKYSKQLELESKIDIASKNIFDLNNIDKELESAIIFLKNIYSVLTGEDNGIASSLKDNKEVSRSLKLYLDPKTNQFSFFD